MVREADRLPVTQSPDPAGGVDRRGRGADVSSLQIRDARLRTHVFIASEADRRPLTQNSAHANEERGDLHPISGVQ